MVILGSTKAKRSLVLNFRIPYYTNWGQSILVSGSLPVLGAWNVKKGLILTPVHQGSELIWTGRVSVPAGFGCDYSYYLVDDERNILRSEGGKRKVVLPPGLQDGVVQLNDLWQTGADCLPFRSAFKNVIFRSSWKLKVERPLHHIMSKTSNKGSVVVHFMIHSPHIEENTSIYVIGSSSKLGQWRERDGLKLFYAGEYLWHVDCAFPIEDFPLKYKYCKCSTEGSFSVECGSSREILVEPNELPNLVSLSDGMLREMPWRGAGVAIPMFSVRSEAGLGVGEFLDLKLLVDWAVQSGFHLIQLLPINDTSVHGMWWDSYPYSSLSVFALHPLYLRVEAISKNIPSEIKEEIYSARERLNQKPDVDYEATMASKLRIAKKIFAVEKDSILKSSPFNKFFTANEGWLKSYAAFCFLRDFFETSDHSQWGRYSIYSNEKLEKLVSEESPHYDIVCFHYYIQYYLHLQFLEASEYARKNGVVLKGDLPIGVDRYSVDTWVYPNLFRMDTSTGACPDFFDKNGQNWGFPTYNWAEMSKDNYAWWRARLTKMAEYFTAFRIDHILGFFRIWELPVHAKTGLLGRFCPSIPLSQEELEREGVWDFHRLTRPYIRTEFLQEKFGSSRTIVTLGFLKEFEKGWFEFNEDCNTEKKIAVKLTSHAEKSMLYESEDTARWNLFDLLQNVVLIRDPEDERKFYPRFNLEDTSSFRDLDDNSKSVLRRLYYDYYFHRQEDLWRRNAFKTLPVLLESSDMLACGEDLGLVPACVHPVMQELGLLGLRIQRMPTEPGLEFDIPSKYGYMTVCAPSCHDCSTLRAWWEEDEERRSRFFESVVGSEEVPPEELVPEITHFILRQHVEAPSMWAIFPIQDLFALNGVYMKRPAKEETINDPTNPRHYWRYRMHVTMETMLKDDGFKDTIRDLIRSAGRSMVCSHGSGPAEESGPLLTCQNDVMPNGSLVVSV